MFLRKTTIGREPLAVAMSGVRMGERVLQIGITNPAAAGAIAAKVGISGQASFVVENERTASRAQTAAERAAALADVHVAPATALPFEAAAFDLVVISADRFDASDAALSECRRVLREGGRVVTIEAGTRSGIAALFRSGGGTPDSAATVAALQRAGFRPVRHLADRDGFSFTDGLKGARG